MDHFKVFGEDDMVAVVDGIEFLVNGEFERKDFELRLVKFDAYQSTGFEKEWCDMDIAPLLGDHACKEIERQIEDAAGKEVLRQNGEWMELAQDYREYGKPTDKDMNDALDELRWQYQRESRKFIGDLI